MPARPRSVSSRAIQRGNGTRFFSAEQPPPPELTRAASYVGLMISAASCFPFSVQIQWTCFQALEQLYKSHSASWPGRLGDLRELLLQVWAPALAVSSLTALVPAQDRPGLFIFALPRLLASLMTNIEAETSPPGGSKVLNARIIDHVADLLCTAASAPQFKGDAGADRLLHFDKVEGVRDILLRVLRWEPPPGALVLPGKEEEAAARATRQLLVSVRVNACRALQRVVIEPAALIKRGRRINASPPPEGGYPDPLAGCAVADVDAALRAAFAAIEHAAKPGEKQPLLGAISALLAAPVWQVRCRRFAEIVDAGWQVIATRVRGIMSARE